LATFDAAIGGKVPGPHVADYARLRCGGACRPAGRLAGGNFIV
jgi:hypothetical protein